MHPTPGGAAVEAAEATRPAGDGRLFAGLASAAAFGGSACLFLMELFAGKLLLPQFGGAPGVWISCLAFFQLALVAAYWYSDRLTRTIQPRRQVLVQAALFAACAAVTTLGLGAAARAALPGRLPAPLAVIVVLAATIGPMFFALATLAPLFAHWHGIRERGAAGVPGHRPATSLYAAGNAGSFAALLGYPVAVEPFAGLGRQADLLMALYAAVAAVALACGLHAASGARAAADRQDADVETTWATWLRWVLLAAIPASWLSSVTTHATVEVAPMPLLWILPLAAYLASFVVVFSPGGRSLRTWEPAALLAAVALVAWLLACRVDDPAWPVIGAHVTAFFVVCVAVHGMLFDERPAVGRLPSFYLALAAGGACGGLWNALAAPLLFDAHHEFPLAVAALAAVAPACWWPASDRLRWKVGAAAIGLGLVGLAGPWLEMPVELTLAILAAAIGGIVIALRHLERAGALLALLAATFWIGEHGQDVVHRARTFFGVLRVREDANGPSRMLIHGRISHGVQLVSDDPERRLVPLSYYHRTGPLGSIFMGMDQIRRPARVAVAGLGVGTIAAYAEPGQEFAFFEIDPEVVRIAGDPRWFTFLSECRGTTRVVVDDARLALAREPDGSLDLLVVDAFSGDSVPTHLLTREALALYGRKLAADGVVAFHISNKFLDLKPVVESLAVDGGWMALDGYDLEVPAEYARVASHWMAVSRSIDVIKAIYGRPTSEHWQWTPADGRAAGRPWTDDRTPVMEALIR